MGLSEDGSLWELGKAGNGVSPPEGTPSAALLPSGPARLASDRRPPELGVHLCRFKSH